jgi:hypothetical protein
MNDLAREIGMMEADDPKWPAYLKELSVLTQLRRAVKFAGEPVSGQRMDELAREMSTLKPGDPRREQIIEEIMRLRDGPKG